MRRRYALLCICSCAAVAFCLATAATGGDKNYTSAKITKSGSQPSAPVVDITLSTGSRDLECPPNSLFEQPVHGPDDPWTAGVSDTGFPYIRYENFSGVSGAIEDVHWWGLEADASLYNCTKDPLQFEITFWNDDSGQPDLTSPACGPYTVTPTRVDTGYLYHSTYQLILYEYSTVLSPGCALTEGWVSIEGVNDPDCRFWWMSGFDGDGYSCGDDGTGLECGGDNDFDPSLCLTGEYVPTYGACCYDLTGDCEDNVEMLDCEPPRRFAANTLCADLDPPCGEVTGACCYPDGSCLVQTPGDCTGDYMGDDTVCDPNPCPPPNDDCDKAINMCCYTTGYGTTVNATESGAPPCVVTPTNDVWYTFIGNGRTVTIDTYGSAIDTLLAVYCGKCLSLTCVDGNDDTGGLQSEVTICTMPLERYYINVSGYGGAEGDIVVNMNCTDPCSPCKVECPPGAIAEGEVCAEDEYDDHFNGGCNSDPPIFSPIACDQTVCGIGSTFTFGGSNYRDTDWYEFTLTDTYTVTWSGMAEFPVVLGFIESNNPGSGDCADITGYISPSDTAEECEEATATTVLPSGTHWVFIAPDAFEGYPCESCTGKGNDYVATLTCEPFTPPPGDNCGDPITVNIPDDLDYSSNGTTCGYLNDYWDTCLGGYDENGDVIYELVVSSNSVVTITVETPVYEDYQGIALDDECPPGDPCMEYVTYGNPDVIEDVLLLAGTTYYLMIDGPDYSDCSTFTIDIVAVAPPTGACCIDQVCTATTEEADCAGDWFEGETCPEFTCPEPITNETCEEATVITTVPYSTTFDNDEATADGTTSCHSAQPMQNDVWFSYTPSEDCYLMLDVDPDFGDGYDGVMSVYRGPDCDNLVEMYCLDDPEPYHVEFAATNGVTYWFQIGDYGSTEGGGLTSLDLDCSAGTGACCIQATGECLEGLTAAECANTSGVYQGDFSECATSVCTGACCLMDQFGTCMDVGEDECIATNGVYYGMGTECATTDCPIPPPNDDCVTAEPLAIGTTGVIVDNTLATDDPESTETCGTGSLNQAVWYSVVGTGNTLTASTCNPGGDFNDTKLQVWCSECATLICVGGDDDDPACGISTVRSTFSWCSELGTTYYVAIGGYSSYMGLMHLTVTDDGVECFDPPVCEWPTGACCSNGVCLATTTEAECDALDGEWFEGETCPDYECPQPCPEDTMTLILDCDNWGDETTWEVVVDGTTDVVCSGGPYSSYEHVEVDCCVEAAGCYDVNLNDSYGDGGADYEIYLNGGLERSGTITGSGNVEEDIGNGCAKDDPYEPSVKPGWGWQAPQQYNVAPATPVTSE